DGEQMAVNTGGSAALANAGQGDVLSGLIAALLAQGMAGWPAAKLGVHLHSAASDALLAQDGRLVTLAGDVAEAAGRILGAQQRAQLWHASPLHENL
ncbi:NAD(P)H-hydrate dehydratase, partial [Chitinimonas sp.]|uniref:NAD(P)H-hydrate dehydratase n=1 Tax=Chitinimonas sp. TaxID=1934313 RepID=UPI0035B1BE01